MSAAVPSVLASLSKGGLQAATKALAIEYASQGIRSNAVNADRVRSGLLTPEMIEGTCIVGGPSAPVPSETRVA